VITVRRIGYQLARKPVTVNAGDNAVGDIALNVSAVNLSEVVVTGTAAPTEKRKLGTSIASVDLTNRSARLASNVPYAPPGAVGRGSSGRRSDFRGERLSSPCVTVHAQTHRIESTDRRSQSAMQSLRSGLDRLPPGASWPDRSQRRSPRRSLQRRS